MGKKKEFFILELTKGEDALQGQCFPTQAAHKNDPQSNQNNL